MYHWKDLLLAILVGLMVADVAMSVMMEKKYPNIIQKLIDSLKSRDGMIAGLLGLAAAVLMAWYLGLLKM